MEKNLFIKYNSLFGWMSLIFLLLLANGCASIIDGKQQEMTFNSEPDGAKITINGRQIGTTPMTTSIDRKKDQTLLIEKEGYKPVTMQLTTTLNGWFWGNILLGGVIGSTTDGISGAYVEYAPSQYYIPLTQIGDNNASLKIETKLFTMINYDKIVKELFTEPGEYTKALFALMEIKEEEESLVISQMRDLAISTNNVLVFAEKVKTISRN